MDKNLQLQNIKQRMLQDKSLPFREEATNLVIGAGSLNPKIVFIGEAPGKSEDLTGIPFNGAAGKILDELLESINLKRDEIYITSVVQYRPPKNRDPKPGEIALFEPYLNQQLNILNSKVIATLGRFSLQKFLPNANIAEVHGLPQNIIWNNKKVTIIPLYHPAACIYRQSLKETLKKDFKIIAQFI